MQKFIVVKDQKQADKVMFDLSLAGCVSSTKVENDEIKVYYYEFEETDKNRVNKIIQEG